MNNDMNNQFLNDPYNQQQTPASNQTYQADYQNNSNGQNYQFNSQPNSNGQNFQFNSQPNSNGQDFQFNSQPNSNGQDFQFNSQPNSNGQDFQSNYNYQNPTSPSGQNNNGVFQAQYGNSYQQMQPPKGGALAIWCMILGILGLVTSCLVIGGIFALVSILLGIISLAKKERRTGMVVTGFITSVLAILISVFALNIFMSDDFKKGFESALADTEAVTEEAEEESKSEEESEESSISVEVPTLPDTHSNFDSDDQENDITEEFTYDDPYLEELDSNMYFDYWQLPSSNDIIVKAYNDNDVPINLYIEVIFYDAYGDEISTDSDTCTACIPYGSCALWASAPTDENQDPVAYADYEIYYQIEEVGEGYKNIASEIGISVTNEDYSNSLLEVEYHNNSNYNSVDSVYAMCLFYKGDELVDFTNDFFSDFTSDLHKSVFYGPSDYNGNAAYDNYEIILNEAIIYEN